VIGFGFSLTQTPIGRILNRSARPVDRPAVFAAQFALSHACWLITYPLAGWLGSAFGLAQAALGLAAVGAAAMVAVFRLWPAVDPVELVHDHADLAPDHPHLREGHDGAHQHAVMIDPLHPQWPRRMA
jgi:predicted MFS family arabinose efflux permease